MTPLQSVSGSAAVTGFIGYLLVTVAAATFGFYAFRNLRINRLESQEVFWWYLVLAGMAGGVFGLAGGAELAFASRPAVAARYAGLLLFIAFIAFAMREVYYNSAAGPSGEPRTTLLRIRRVELVFAAVVIVESMAVIALGRTIVVRVVEGAGGVLFTAYGVWYGSRVESAMQGTTLDTLARHLIPVLLAAGFLGLSDLAFTVGLDPVLRQSVTDVFVVIVAAFLASSTIRLQQNVAGRPVVG